MKKTLKMAVSGVLALTIAGGIATSASAATQAKEGTLIMYHNIQGGPSHSFDSIEIESNANGTSYYAQCTTLTNSSATVTADVPINKGVVFKKTGIISFQASTEEDTIKFYGDMNTIDNSKFSRVNINIGY